LGESAKKVDRAIVRAAQKGLVNELLHTRIMYTISTDKSRLDVAMIHRFLSEQSYWAKNIPLPVVRRAIENSLCFGAFDGREQVGFARVVTDYAIFGYVGDVFVLPGHRGRGVSKLLMRAIREHPSLQGLRRWHLLTDDGHRLYEQFCFQSLEKPQRHMEIAVKKPYG
jgi:GNAT superfamily N-acetyltransferase